MHGHAVGNVQTCDLKDPLPATTTAHDARVHLYAPSGERWQSNQHEAIGKTQGPGTSLV